MTRRQISLAKNHVSQLQFYGQVPREPLAKAILNVFGQKLFTVTVYRYMGPH